jgi:hypothetical protein
MSNALLQLHCHSLVGLAHTYMPLTPGKCGCSQSARWEYLLRAIHRTYQQIRMSISEAVAVIDSGSVLNF